ncbi:hypothetical protein GQ43DRAFT_438029 [Delitschia confertaspora ATCC 74209]|uniref:Uncharacterized protein n=1 Tax=Delitschia confertaspora ATCC 74209 TaxID=1513339 RepID=A0A9P4JRM5_9PLEO|nr:hypothetical protein GQ43DRAFT_438029 [Delitschia confertaspora ATCC 74209]
MPSFTALPPEIRDQICEHVILSPLNSPPPLTDPDQLPNGRQSYQHPQLNSWLTRDEALYLPTPFTTTSTPLLLLSRQLHAGTTATLKRLQARAHSYDLDIVLVDEKLLLPTWIRVPALTTSVSTVRVNFRIAGMFTETNGLQKKMPRYRLSNFAAGCGGGPTMSWQLYSILERFFMVGPTGEGSDGMKDRNVVIESLRVNVETPPNVAPEAFGPPIRKRKREESAEKGASPQDLHILDPAYLTSFIKSNLEMLLRMSYHTAEYGCILYEHLDELVLTRDAVEEVRWDIAEMFRDLTFIDAFRRDREIFDDWKKRTSEKRKVRGLREA